MTPSLVDKGYGGWITPGSSFSLTLLSPNVTWEQANETFFPFFDYATNQSVTAGLTAHNYSVWYDSFNSFYSEFYAGHGSDLLNLELSSLLLPEYLFTGDTHSLAVELLNVPGISYYLIAGGAVSRVDPDSTGLHPAWRTALAYTVAEIGWADGTSSNEINALRANFKLTRAKWDSLAPNSCAYFNEASPYEFNWKKSLFGPHYDKLKAIKYKYDPEGLFIVLEGVGSDDWDPSLNCRVC